MLAKIRALAQKEGLQVQSLIEEALADLLEKRRHIQKPRQWVMDVHRENMQRRSWLYKKLAAL